MWRCCTPLMCLALCHLTCCETEELHPSLRIWCGYNIAQYHQHLSDVVDNSVAYSSKWQHLAVTLQWSVRKHNQKDQTCLRLQTKCHRIMIKCKKGVGSHTTYYTNLLLIHTILTRNASSLYEIFNNTTL